MNINNIPRGFNFEILGSNPVNEPCAQFGTEGYHGRAKKECRAYIAQLTRIYGEPPVGCRFIILDQPHELTAQVGEDGRIILPVPVDNYHEVALLHPDGDEEGEKYFLEIEKAQPEWWDDEARIEMGLPPAAELVHLKEKGKAMCGHPNGKFTDKVKELTCPSCIDIVA